MCPQETLSGSGYYDTKGVAEHRIRLCKMVRIPRDLELNGSHVRVQSGAFHKPSGPPAWGGGAISASRWVPS